MKRTLAIFLIITALILAISAIASADYHDTIEKSFNVTSGGTLTVISDISSVNVKSHSSKTVAIEIDRTVNASDSKAKNILDDFDISFDKSGDDVIVKIDWKRSNRLCNVNICQEITVMVPESYNLELDTFAGGITVTDLDGSVSATTVGGGISLDNVTGPIDCDATGGSVTVDDADDDVKVKTAGGGISLRRIAGSIDADAAGGRINIEGADDYISAKTAGSSIRATLDKEFAKGCRLETSGGGITLTLPRDSNADIDAHATVGCISSNLPIDISSDMVSKSLKGELNDGGPLVHLRATAGNIKINQL